LFFSSILLPPCRIRRIQSTGADSATHCCYQFYYPSAWGQIEQTRTFLSEKWSKYIHLRIDEMSYLHAIDKPILVRMMSKNNIQSALTFIFYYCIQTLLFQITNYALVIVIYNFIKDSNFFLRIFFLIFNLFNLLLFSIFNYLTPKNIYLVL